MHCKDKKYIFMHNPKCAGTFIKHFILSNTKKDYEDNQDLKVYQEDHDVFGELKLESIIKKYDIDIKGYKTFTFVRNPWDRVVSMFIFLGGWKYNYITKNKKELNLLSKIKIFNEFYRNKDFEGFVEHFFLRGNMVSFHTGYIESIVKRSMVGGEIKIDYFLKQEDMKGSLDKVAELLGFEINKIYYDWRLNSSQKFALKKVYKDYYNSRTKKIIEKIFEKDIETFNYEF